MKKQAKKLIPILIVAALIFCVNVTAYAAEMLPNGSVKGLPEKLVALDDSGNSVNENGEYFFHVENMQPQVIYTKNIQIMNLREDASYKITFRAEPLTKKGEIDLENECVCEISLDGKEIYSGKVTGEGTPDIRDNALSLGTYRPGESHVMKVDVKWNGTSVGGFIDNGQRVVTNSGVEITREKSGENYISGETEFKWIFYAEVAKQSGTDEIESIPYPSENVSVPETSYVSTPGQPGGSGNTIYDFVRTGEVVVCTAIIIIMAAALILIFLLVSKKKKQRSDP